MVPLTSAALVAEAVLPPPQMDAEPPLGSSRSMTPLRIRDHFRWTPNRPHPSPSRMIDFARAITSGGTSDSLRFVANSASWRVCEGIGLTPLVDQILRPGARLAGGIW